MSVSPLVPALHPADHGHRGARRRGAARRHRAPVWVLEPPIDTDARPSGHRRHQLPARASASPGDAPLIVTVSRLAHRPQARRARRRHRRGRRARGATRPVRLVDRRRRPGRRRARGARRRAVNRAPRPRGRQLLRPAVGPARPRTPRRTSSSAWAARRCARMSIGRPVVVQGERGFSLPFEPPTLPYFLHHGFWGLGDGRPARRAARRPARPLLAGRARRAELGALRAPHGRGALLARRALDAASSRSTTRCSRAAARASSGRRRDRRRPRARSSSSHAHDPRRKRRAPAPRRRCWRRRAVRGAACACLRHRRRAPRRASGVDWDGLVVLCAANNWDDVKLADRHMAERLTAHAPVLYVDPPISHLTRFNKPSVGRVDQAPAPEDRGAPARPLHADRAAEAEPPGDGRADLADRPPPAAARRARGSAATSTPSISTWLFVDAYGALGERRRVYWWQDDPVGAAAHWGASAERLGAAERAAGARLRPGRRRQRGRRGALARRAACAPPYLPNGCDAPFFAGVRRASTTAADVALPRPDRGLRRAPQQPDRPGAARGGRRRRASRCC